MAKMKWTAAEIPSQAGKTALVTGANSGIGFQAARELARKGALVFLGVRNREKGEAARKLIADEVPGARVEVAVLDVASLASVRKFAVEFVGLGVGLDLLINNAGVMALNKRKVTEDGFERQFGTNHLGHFALTGLLMPALLRADAPRVVTVASLAHRNGKMEWDNLQAEKSYSPWGQYGMTKLSNILFARELDRRAKEKGWALTSVAVHPGVARTQIFENGPGTGSFKGVLVKLFSPLITQSEAMGALPTLYAATSPEVKGGEYIGPDGRGELKGYPVEVQPKPQALDDEAGRKLWQVSEELTGVVFP